MADKDKIEPDVELFVQFEKLPSEERRPFLERNAPFIIDSLLKQRYDIREQQVLDRMINADVSPETFGRIARFAELSRNERRIIDEDFKDPTFRGVVDTTLKTLTGNVLGLDDFDQHIKAGVLGQESPITRKLQSLQGLRLLDPAGNLAEALGREELKRSGQPPALVDKGAQAIGFVASVLTPGSGLKNPKVQRLATEVYINSLFSGPQTQVSNILANSLVSAYVIGERTIAAGTDLFRAGLTGKSRQVFFGEPVAMAFGMFNALTDAVHAGLKTFVTGQSKFSGSIMEDVATQARAAHKKNVGELFDENEATVIREGIDYWGTLWRSPTRGLGATDEFYKTILSNAETYARAYRNAVISKKVLGDDAGPLFQEIAKRIKRSRPTVRREAMEFAIINTFQRDLESLPGAIGGVGRFAKRIQDLPMGRVIVPVIRTPTNLAHFTAERTPILGALTKTFRDDIAAGGARASQAMAKQAAGATLFATFVHLGMSNLITDNGPADASLRLQKQELTGWQPCALKIGDRFHSINRLEPVGAMLCLAADFSRVVGHLDERKASDLAQLMSRSVTDNIFDGRFLSGALDVFDAMAGAEDARQRLATGILRRVTPAGGALRALATTLDPVRRELDPGPDPEEEGALREARLLMNLVRSQIPEYSKTLFARKNLWGEPVELPMGFQPAELSLVYTTTNKKESAGDEVTRLAELGLLELTRVRRVILGQDPETRPPDEPPSPLNTGIELTDVEYDELEKLAGHALKVDGLGLKEEVTRLVTKDEEYRKANDVERAIIIAATIRGYRQAAVGQLLENNPAILEAFERRVEEKARRIEEPRR